MTALPFSAALIVGVGPGIGASVGRALAGAGLKVCLAARDAEKLAPLATEIGGKAYAVDATDPASVERLFAQVDAELGTPDVVVYNASGRVRGRIADLDPEAVRRAIDVSAFGGFLAVRQAAIRMVPRGHGAILLTGATASVKGFPCHPASPWASSPCVAWRRARPANWDHRASTWPTSSSTAACAAPRARIHRIAPTAPWTPTA
jgi:NAD(P)-dependent dehydrogenase (short-subunit alcohol dehydrogenase family)